MASRTPPPAGPGFSPLAVASAAERGLRGVRARWLRLLGCGAQAQGLWRAAQPLWCVASSRLSRLPMSPAPAGRFSIAEPPGTLPLCSFLLSRLPLLHMLLIIVCVCLHSLIHIHRNSLGTLCPGPVPGVAVYGASEDPEELVSTSHPRLTVPHIHMIQPFSFLVYVLVHSGCSNEISHMAWPINHRE